MVVFSVPFKVYVRLIYYREYKGLRLSNFMQEKILAGRKLNPFKEPTRLSPFLTNVNFHIWMDENIKHDWHDLATKEQPFTVGFDDRSEAIHFKMRWF